MACNSKVEASDIDDNVVHCVKCDMMQLKSSATPEVSANLYIQDTFNKYFFVCFLTQIVRRKEITIPNLLSASPFTCRYENKIITGVAFE